MACFSTENFFATRKGIWEGRDGRSKIVLGGCLKNGLKINVAGMDGGRSKVEVKGLGGVVVENDLFSFGREHVRGVPSVDDILRDTFAVLTQRAT